MGIGEVVPPAPRSDFRSAIFLDRDGVINSLVLNPATGRMESPLTAAEFRLIDGAIPALLLLRNAGYPLILVSNQPNYALGKSSYGSLLVIQHRLVAELEAAGVHFARFCYCLHHPQGVTPGYSHVCACRKPSPAFLLQARDDLGLNLSESWMIGDQPTDTQCGRAAGVRTIRIGPPKSGLRTSLQVADPCADYIVRDLAEAARLILDPMILGRARP